MTCPHCSPARIAARKHCTSLGYRTFACHECQHIFNERTAGSFNHLQYPTDVVTMAVIWRLRYKLSFRDVAERRPTPLLMPDRTSRAWYHVRTIDQRAVARTGNDTEDARGSLR